MRPMLGVVLALAGAFLAANILAEYELEGYVPWAGAIAIGALVGECLANAGRWRGRAAMAVGGAIAFLGFAYCGRLETDSGVEPFAATTWIAAALAGAVAVYRLRPARTSGA